MQTFDLQDLQMQAAEPQEAAMSEPVIITCGGRPRLVLMSMQEYDRLRGRSRNARRTAELPDAVADDIEALALARRVGSTLDLTDTEVALMKASQVPAEHDYDYEDDPEPTAATKSELS